ncbi:hypothetical protein I7I53_07758 [Histoplasma capsulatum var. duboisii H88]|uniref:Uncharacterized protein n=1 Tax=Ajellomyces capsulatus (strain H88) TaxID=544711 RepID=A0A8A1LE73_AJEC8|nr:hypothetical protein I7I53_07758 [Histoplasma capsulatum var. duboisii H88]
MASILYSLLYTKLITNAKTALPCDSTIALTIPKCLLIPFYLNQFSIKWISLWSWMVSRASRHH